MSGTERVDQAYSTIGKGQILTMVIIYRRENGVGEDLRETGTIGIGAKVGSFICSLIYHLSASA